MRIKIDGEATPEALANALEKIRHRIASDDGASVSFWSANLYVKAYDQNGDEFGEELFFVLQGDPNAPHHPPERDAALKRKRDAQKAKRAADRAEIEREKAERDQRFAQFQAHASEWAGLPEKDQAAIISTLNAEIERRWEAIHPLFRKKPLAPPRYAIDHGSVSLQIAKNSLSRRLEHPLWEWDKPWAPGFEGFGGSIGREEKARLLREEKAVRPFANEKGTPYASNGAIKPWLEILPALIARFEAEMIRARSDMAKQPKEGDRDGFDRSL